MKIAKIAIDVPTYKYFNYIIPEKFYATAKIGSFVIVPFGSMKKEGLIVDILGKNEEERELKSILFPLSNELNLSPDQIKIGSYFHNYFFNSPGPSFFMMKLPGSRKNLNIYYSTTEKGKKAFEKKEFEGIKYKILQVLNNERKYTKLGIQKIVKWDKVPYILNYLAKGGYIKKEEEIKKRGNHRRLLYIKPMRKDNEGLTSDEMLIMQFLRRYGGWCPFSIVKKKFGKKKTDIKKLEKNGYIEYRYFDDIIDTFIDPNLKSIEKNILNKPQKIAYDNIMKSIKQDRATEIMLMGITGSGKTEVYFQAARETVKMGEKVLVLVPEISLTPQVSAKFKAYFNERLAVYHSKQGIGDKRRIYEGVKKGLYDVVIGPRSILFLPLKNIGLIVMDEFQDDSYNQDQKEPYYNGMKTARFIGNLHNATLLYISATPLVTSYYRAINKELEFYHLPKRAVKEAELPEIEIINMSEESDFIFSTKLCKEIRNTIDAGNQVILFYNRRGYFRTVKCPKCGYIFKCPNCEIPLIYHYDMNELMCHYCGNSIEVPSKCPECGHYHLNFKGLGIEQIKDRIQELFPKYKVGRLDQDISKDILKMQDVLGKFKEGELDILLGTQIVAKGIDFLNVTLVGVISAEVLFSFPDYLTSQRAFTLLMQVSGRAGRGKKKGKVIVQTYNPSNEVIKYSVTHDYEKFYNYEIKLRKKLKFPPFSHLSKIVVSGKNDTKVKANGTEIKEFLDNSNIIAYGPMPAIVPKINNVFYYEIVFKYDDREIITPLIHKLKEKYSNIRIK